MTAFRTWRGGIGGAALSALLIGGLLVSSADAYLLKYDLRVAGGGKVAEVMNVGDVVNLELWAIVANNDGNSANDGVRNLAGSFLSAFGGLLGNLREGVKVDGAGNPDPMTGKSINVAAPFNEGAAHFGGDPWTTGTSTLPVVLADADGDGDVDIGSDMAGTVPPNNPFFVADPGVNHVMGDNVDATVDTSTPGETAFLIGMTQFTFTGGPEGAETQVWFQPRVRTLGALAAKKIHVFTSDGDVYTLEGTDEDLLMGAPVTITPEPATMALLAVGGLAALVRRRKA